MDASSTYLSQFDGQIRRKSKAWLMVEDDPDLRSMLSAMIALWGRSPLVFEDGYHAMAWFDDLEGGVRTPVPELALLDLSMPGPNGLDLAERLRATSDLSTIPIIILTAMTLRPEQHERIDRLGGVVKVLSKPVPSMKWLRSTLEEMLAV